MGALLAKNESDIRDVIFEYLQKKGHFVWRDKQPMRRGGGYKGAHFPESSGVSDILGISKKNVFFAIEIKKPKVGVVSKEQEAFLLQVNKRGGFGFVATDLRDVIDRGL